MEKIQAILLAGGKGTRLAPLTDTLPKPLVPVAGKPIMTWILEHLKKSGINNVALSVAHLGNLIEAHYGNGKVLNMNISYLREPEPMGTGGWTRLVAWDELADDVIVANADNIYFVNVAALLNRHRALSGATLVGVRKPSEAVRGNEIAIPSANGACLERYVDRTESNDILAASQSVFVSAGWYVFSPSLIRQYIPHCSPISNEQHIWPALAANMSGIGFYEATEPWFETDNMERLLHTEQYLISNYVVSTETQTA